MSKPVLKHSEYVTAAARELRRWPSVTTTRKHLSKHASLILTYNSQSRCVTCPLTGSDHRGPMNHVGDIRKALLDMGATRTPDQRSISPKRQRNRTEPKRICLGEKAVKDPSRDPWAALANLDFPEPPPRVPDPNVPAKPSFWRRLFNRLGFHRKDT